MAEKGKKTLDESLQAFNLDTMITLKVGTGPEVVTYQVQQGILEATSDFFRKALQDDRFEEGHTKFIGLEDDDVVAWKNLLYWILYCRLPQAPDEDQDRADFKTMAKCWILGDKYNITRFQDDAMIRMPHYANTDKFHLKPETYKELLAATPSDSTLMRLLAEEVVWEVQRDKIESVEFNVLDGTRGFWPAFLLAWGILKDNNEYTLNRMMGVEESDRGPAHWREYMVGDLPKMMNVFDDRGG